MLKRWRSANPKIVQLWSKVEKYAITALSNPGKPYRLKVGEDQRLEFIYNRESLQIKLPSSRCLVYWQPSLFVNKWKRAAVKYKGVNQTNKQFTYIDSYGGKFIENIVQAIARDLLANTLLKMSNLSIVLHVHDEIGIEEGDTFAPSMLTEINNLMSTPPKWAKGLPLGAEGFISKFYKKD